MRQIENTSDLQEYLNRCRNQQKTVGFVPTMGALHPGHLSLVELAGKENDVVIVSIFVNPTQFNDPADLEKYPRTLEQDTQLLSQSPCDALFYPQVQDVYSTDFIPRKVDLGKLDYTLEGHYRPGHFEGVVNVVQRLFDLVAPNRAYFGRKDFQQVAVIKAMVKTLGYSTEIIVGDTIREESGLAMSSRNLRLNPEEKNEAKKLSQILFRMKEWAKNDTPEVCKRKGSTEINKSKLQLEYLEIVHPLTFEPLKTAWTAGATACAVAYCGDVRLIDNLELVSPA